MKVSYTKMEISNNILLVELLLFLAIFAGETAQESSSTSSDCGFPQIFNFGDSNSDTGGIAAAFYPPGPPSGQSFFKRPVGRASDGRLIIDFIGRGLFLRDIIIICVMDWIAENLGLPYLSAYLDSIGSKYHQGANFATGGATIMRPNMSWFASGASPFNLEIQVEHFTQFKERTSYFYTQGNNETETITRLPNPENFPKAIYTFDIGQNDLGAVFKLSSQQLETKIVEIIDQFVTQIRAMHERGARTFWIHNTGPVGCLPVSVIKVRDSMPGDLDEHGCIKYQNNIAMNFNSKLKEKVVQLRKEFSSDATFTYVDMYIAKYELISDAKNQGFEDPFKICCGYHDMNNDIWCGNKATINNGSKVYAGSCANPSVIISWDGVHYSEAANHWIANRIVNGSLSDPPIPISQACQKQII
ncbi:hypothetical protein LIER_17149 [Lithospermum erythrorhizon]|uniref:Uncharacterized protein n=1 Tax=Lithospermum erythrorhizon TaxID=34254 RepID=A0AAV3Q988_LITER